MLLYSLRETGVVDDYYIRTTVLSTLRVSFLPSSLPSHTLCRPWLQSEVNLAAPLFLPFGFDYTTIYLCRPPTKRLSFSATVGYMCVPQRYCFDVSVVFSVRSNRGWKLIVSSMSWGRESTTLLGSLSIVLPYIIQELQLQQQQQLLLLLLLECCILY